MPAVVATARLAAEACYLMLSDLHLGDGGRTDLFGRKDALLIDLLDRRAPEVEGILLAGDILDSLQARHPGRVRRAHRGVLERLEEVARRRPVWYLLGNHDEPRFVTELLPSSRLCESVALGECGRVMHGHQFDPHFFDGPLADRDPRLVLWLHGVLESLSGETIRLPFADHDNLTNRIAHWVFYRHTMAWHLVSQVAAWAGRPGWLRRWAAHHDDWARSQWGDHHAMLIPALASLAAGPEQVFVTGHAHQAGKLDRFQRAPSERVSGEPAVAWRDPARRSPAPQTLSGKTYINFGSLSFGSATYALWRGGAVELWDHASGQEIGDHAYRFALSAPEIPGMREWWSRYYRGFCRYDSEAVRRDTSFRERGPRGSLPA
jgi:UDP-2,3-diacylglucosamine pyrophosphatase LpxH